MKQFFPVLTLLFFLAAAPAFGQGTTKLLTAQSQMSLDLGTGEVAGGDSTSYTYNNLHQLIGTVYWDYDLDSASWKSFARLTNYSYDANGNLLSNTEQEGNDAAGWVNYSRTTYTYDANNLKLTAVGELWDGTVWAPDYTSTWVYNANGDPVSEIGEGSRYFFTYNADGLLDTSTQESLVNGVWENFFRTIYDYTPNDTKVSVLVKQIWENDQWANYSRTSYTYDASGDAVVTLDQTWTNGAWDNIGNLLSDYDADHNVVHWVSQSWSGTAWDDFLQMFAEYDDESNILKARLEFNLGAWQPYIHFRFYYAEFVSTNAPVQADFQIFPNPVSSVLMLKSEGLAQAQIFDNKGQLLRSQRLSGQVEETLCVGDLPAGNYVLQVTSADGKIGVKPFQVAH